jgi:hypothetical protein
LYTPVYCALCRAQLTWCEMPLSLPFAELSKNKLGSRFPKTPPYPSSLVLALFYRTPSEEFNIVTTLQIASSGPGNDL